MQARIKLIHAHSAPRCQHIKTNGLRCQSPAMKQRRLCYYHEQHRLSHPGTLQFPLLEDANAVQMAIQQVIQAIALGTLDNKRAGLILYGLQTAAANLPNCDFEPSEERDEIVLSTSDYDTMSDLPCHDPSCPDNTLNEDDDDDEEADEDEDQDIEEEEDDEEENIQEEEDDDDEEDDEDEDDEEDEDEEDDEDLEESEDEAIVIASRAAAKQPFVSPTPGIPAQPVEPRPSPSSVSSVSSVVKTHRLQIPSDPTT